MGGIFRIDSAVIGYEDSLSDWRIRLTVEQKSILPDLREMDAMPKGGDSNEHHGHPM